MERIYSLKEVVLMSGLSERTIRNYLNMGILKGEKRNGSWGFSGEDLDRFFKEPFVKEALRIRQNSEVFDFLADFGKEKERACVLLNVPCDAQEGKRISGFFCERMNEAEDLKFSFRYSNGMARISLSGDSLQAGKIMEAYWKQAAE